MNPPLVSFSIKSSSYSYPKIRKAGRFAVNILSSEQVAISNQFAQRGIDKWHGIITGSLYWIDCEIHAEHAAGDHMIVIGEVKAIQLQENTSAQPLLYFKGQYGNLAAFPAGLN